MLAEQHSAMQQWSCRQVVLHGLSSHYQSQTVNVLGLKKLLLHICMYLNELMCITCVQVPQRPEGTRSPGTEVTTGSYELSDVGAENKTQVLVKGVSPLNC